MKKQFWKFAGFLLAGSFILSACGVKGELKTPPPLWGDKAKQEAKKENNKKQ